MRNLTPILALVFWAAACTRPSPKKHIEKSIPDFTLADQFGELHRLKNRQDMDAIVLIWQSNQCPTFRKSLPLIRGTYQKLDSKRIAFYFINADPKDSLDEIAKASRQQRLPFAILKDATQMFSHDLAISHVLQTLVIDPKSWRQISQGPLNTTIAKIATATSCPIDYSAIKKPVTYVKDVAPILKERCLACHHVAGIAPWAMTDYRKVKGWSKMIGEVVATKRMPPWEVDSHLVPIKNDMTLTPKEAGTILQWIRTGSKRGDGKDPLLAFAPPANALGKPDLILKLPKQEVPALGNVSYRYFALPRVLKKDQWIAGAIFRPENPKVVHHARVFYGDGSLMKMAREVFSPRDEDSMIQPHKQDFYLTTYSPGVSEYLYPEEAAKLIKVEQDIVAEIHYTTTGKVESDESYLELYFAKKPAKKIFFSNVNSEQRQIDIPANKVVELIGTPVTFKTPVLLHWIFPHMHYRGKSFRLKMRLPGRPDRTIFFTPRYSFLWQHTYVFEKPLLIPKGATLIPTATFDNTTSNRLNPDPNQTVHFGPRSIDEMLLAILHYTEE